jgi:hypothetical protein
MYPINILMNMLGLKTTSFDYIINVNNYDYIFTIYSFDDEVKLTKKIKIFLRVNILIKIRKLKLTKISIKNIYF